MRSTAKPTRPPGCLRKTITTGNADRRVRQNLALVLGLDGKFDEARQLASVDMPAANAQDSMSYLRNMVDTQGNVAALDEAAGGTARRRRRLAALVPRSPETRPKAAGRAMQQRL